MNPVLDGFSVDITELEALARKADALADTLRAAWNQDWFEADAWPETDPLRTAVITYRSSLHAAMERLSTAVDGLSVQVRTAADTYLQTDAEAARAFERIAGADGHVERGGGSAES